MSYNNMVAYGSILCIISGCVLYDFLTHHSYTFFTTYIFTEGTTKINKTILDQMFMRLNHTMADAPIQNRTGVVRVRIFLYEIYIRYIAVEATHFERLDTICLNVVSIRIRKDFSSYP